MFTKLHQFRRVFFTIVFSFLFSFSFSSVISAVDPNFSIYPNGGTVMDKEEGFVVDVLIDTAGEEITSAKFALSFDPEVLQIKKAERNNSLFEQYPGDEATIDNDNGMVMLSGFTQSGNTELYKTVGESDIFARITFEVVQEGDTEISWEYGDNNTLFDTVMYGEGSPPQDIITNENEAVIFTIGERVIDPSNVDTGLTLDKYILAIGSVLILFGSFMVFTKPNSLGKNSGTVVVYDEE